MRYSIAFYVPAQNRLKHFNGNYSWLWFFTRRLLFVCNSSNGWNAFSASISTAARCARTLSRCCFIYWTCCRFVFAAIENIEIVIRLDAPFWIGFCCLVCSPNLVRWNRFSAQLWPSHRQLISQWLQFTLIHMNYESSCLTVASAIDSLMCICTKKNDKIMNLNQMDLHGHTNKLCVCVETVIKLCVFHHRQCVCVYDWNFTLSCGHNSFVYLFICFSSVNGPALSHVQQCGSKCTCTFIIWLNSFNSHRLFFYCYTHCSFSYFLFLHFSLRKMLCLFVFTTVFPCNI